MLGWGLNLGFAASEAAAADIYLVFPPFVSTASAEIVLDIPSLAQLTSTENLQKPIDFVMADNPPVVPVLSDPPRALRGPRLVERKHVTT